MRRHESELAASDERDTDSDGHKLTKKLLTNSLTKTVYLKCKFTVGQLSYQRISQNLFLQLEYPYPTALTPEHLNLGHHLALLYLIKTATAYRRHHLIEAKCKKPLGRRGLAPDPVGGAYDAPHIF